MPSIESLQQKQQKSLSQLAEEIRQTCRAVVDDGKESVFAAGRRGERAIGEWLATVRQTKEALIRDVAPAVPKRRNPLLEDPAASLRGDLTRIHVMRVKGDRGTMQDALIRSSRRAGR